MPEDDCEVTKRRAVPSAVVLASMFQSLRSVGVACDVSNALSHLRSAKRAFLAASHKRQGQRRQQPTLKN